MSVCSSLKLLREGTGGSLLRRLPQGLRLGHVGALSLERVEEPRAVALPGSREAAPAGAVGSARMQSTVRHGFCPVVYLHSAPGGGPARGDGGTNSPRKVDHTFCY